MGNRIAGTCYIKVDGEQLELDGSLECAFSDVKREDVTGVAACAGFKETALAPFIKGTFIFVKAFPMEKIKTNTDMTITAELANGKVYTLSGAWLNGETSVKADDGKIDLEFKGLKGIWQ